LAQQQKMQSKKKGTKGERARFRGGPAETAKYLVWWENQTNQDDSERTIKTSGKSQSSDQT